MTKALTTDTVLIDQEVVISVVDPDDVVRDVLAEHVRDIDKDVSAFAAPSDFTDATDPFWAGVVILGPSEAPEDMIPRAAGLVGLRPRCAVIMVVYELTADVLQQALRAGVIFALAAAFVVRPARVIATAAIALTALWFVSSQQWRFLLPALFLYAAIVAAGTYALGRSVRMLGVVVLAALGAFVVATNWIPQTRSEASASLIPALAYMSGRQSAQVYLNRRLETFGAAQWVAALGVSGNEVGALDDVRDYYFPPGTAWLNPYYQQAVALDWSAPSSQRYRPLVARGISYLVVNENPAYLHRTPTGVDWTAFANDKRTVLRELYSANGVSVYALGSAH